MCPSVPPPCRPLMLTRSRTRTSTFFLDVEMVTRPINIHWATIEVVEALC